MKLNNYRSFVIPRPERPGRRHDQLVQLAASLSRAGVTAEGAVKMMEGFQPDMPKGEIEEIADWAFRGLDRTAPQGQLPTPPEPEPPEKVVAQRCGPVTLEELFSLSPIPIPTDPKEALCVYLEKLYRPDEHLNVVIQYDQRQKDDDSDGASLFKASPFGSGETRTVCDWIPRIRSGGVPMGRAGAWFRPNPVQTRGSGAGGACRDVDVTSHRFLLVESDILAQTTVLGLISSLNLPIAAVYTTGGSSRNQQEQGIHALARLDCNNAEEYRKTASALLEILSPYGIDQANKNPSRMSRLPGAVRTIGGVGDGLQKLIYLNPNATSAPIK